ncbi:membrane biogenesis protein [Candidatus Pacearchaeota archaeon]|nr:membrane biogenesis protein [Candidatus Pacearchaeota archaeon]
MKFEEVFTIKKPIIGMIHLAGKDKADRMRRALYELDLYEKEGVDGAIIEDYHGSVEDVYDVLKESNTKGFKIIRGVNVLSDPYSSFSLAQEFGARFVQFDSVQSGHIDSRKYDRLRNQYKDIVVLGGVRFKYTSSTGDSLEEDINDGRNRCDAVVTTGDGTGIETPLQKLKDFKSILEKFPFIVGAGVTKENVYQQLMIADGAIIGSYFKNSYTMNKIDRERVRSLMDVVNEVRNTRNN